MPNIVWFRSDLRVDDHPALSHAAIAPGSEDGLLALFVLCPIQWKDRHDWGAPKVDFLLRSLAALSTQLAALEIPLLIRNVPTFDQLPELVTELCRDLSSATVFANRELEVNEVARDRRVAASLQTVDAKLELFDDQTILPPTTVRKPDGSYYSVYTPFRKRWQAAFEQHDLRLTPTPRKSRPLDRKPDPVPHTLPEFAEGTSGIRPDLWPAGSEAAQSLLERFLDRRVEGYASGRDAVAVAGTSRLSPYLALGVLSPRAAFLSALSRARGRLGSAPEGVKIWIQELIWREFYRYVLIGFPQTCRGQAFKQNTETIPWRDDPAGFDRWCHGQTGIPLVDAGMRQLLQTGWMHNRARMVTAMFLTKNLFIDWRHGERYFMQRLVDGDFASNNGGWQWSASTGTDAAPYFRIFNPWSQAKRFDADGRYIKRFIPELVNVAARDLHDPKRLSKAETGDYPAPMVDCTETRRRAIDTFRHHRSQP